jgi:8-oxo-dGTP diphosphatase
MSEKYKDYVLGFVFNNAKTEVLLILKNRPDFQKGKFNGIGGKVEKSDTDYGAAFRREFKEETGIDLHWSNIYQFSMFTDRKQDKDFIHRIFCFATCYDFGNKFESQWATATEEIVFRIKVDDITFFNIQGRILPNVAWLIPMAINRLNSVGENCYLIEVKE